jgi:hypothetical protein
MPDTPTLTFPPGVPAWAQLVGDGTEANPWKVDTVPAVVAQLPPGVHAATVAGLTPEPYTVRLTVGANRHG